MTDGSSLEKQDIIIPLDHSSFLHAKRYYKSVLLDRAASAAWWPMFYRASSIFTPFHVSLQFMGWRKEQRGGREGRTRNAYVPSGSGAFSFYYTFRMVTALKPEGLEERP